MKKFNITGTCFPNRHYMVDLTSRVAQIKAMVEGYIKILQDSWMNYQPEEEPKLKGAEVRTVGDYVMYAILSDADKETAFKTFTAALK